MTDFFQQLHPECIDIIDQTKLKTVQKCAEKKGRISSIVFVVVFILIMFFVSIMIMSTPQDSDDDGKKSTSGSPVKKDHTASLMVVIIITLAVTVVSLIYIPKLQVWSSTREWQSDQIKIDSQIKNSNNTMTREQAIQNIKKYRNQLKAAQIQADATTEAAQTQANAISGAGAGIAAALRAPR